MYKKNIDHQFYRISAGFLLTEFMIAFALLSLVVVICAHAFFSAVQEYTHAKQRLHLFILVQNNQELSWSGNRRDGSLSDERIKKKTVFVEPGIMLPNMPKLQQEWLEINMTNKKGQSSPIALRGCIRET